MKKIFYLTIIALSFPFIFTNCANDDDFINQQQPPPVANNGYVNFDGLTIPLTFADMYFVERQGAEELWRLELSENFIGQGSTYTQAYIFMEFIKPVGANISANYATDSAIRPVLFAAYFEEVDIVNGVIQNYNLFIPDEDIIYGLLRVRANNPNGVHYFDVELDTFDGFLLKAEFEGLLRY